MKTLLLVLLSLTLFNCTVEKRRNIVLQIDYSASVPKETTERYIANITKMVVPNLGPKDILTIQFVDGCSRITAERIYHLDLSNLNFEDIRDGINHMKDSASARLIQYVNKTVVDELVRAINVKTEERKVCSNFTDILGSLEEAQKLIVNDKSYMDRTDLMLNDAIGNVNYEYQTVFIIYSDMVNENPSKTMDFTKFDKLDKEQIKQKFMAYKEKNKLPDLTNAKVFVYGATSTTNSRNYATNQIENIKYFWELYFYDTGAELMAYGYDTEIEINSYLIKP